MVACMVRDHEAAGSNPATPTKFIKKALLKRVFFVYIKINLYYVAIKQKLMYNNFEIIRKYFNKKLFIK